MDKKEIKSVDEKLSEILDVDVPEERTTKNEIIKTDPDSVEHDKDLDDLDNDFDFARKNLKRMLLRGEEAFEDAMRLAQDGESPRAWEVVAQLMKNGLDGNKDLLEIHQKRKNIKKKDQTKQEPQQLLPGSINVDKAVFYGTPNDLMKKIEESNE